MTHEELCRMEQPQLIKLIDEGKLIYFPCKVGDEIFNFRWSVKKEKYEIHTGNVKEIRYSASDGSIMVSDGEMYKEWGKTIFLTREEAEKALKDGEVNGKDN